MTHSKKPIARLSDEEIKNRILYRDGLIFVLDKPSGIPVHKAGPAPVPEHFRLFVEGS